MICCFAPVQKTLLEVARDPRHLGAEIGFPLHSPWGKKTHVANFFVLGFGLSPGGWPFLNGPHLPPLRFERLIQSTPERYIADRWNKPFFKVTEIWSSF
jgi:hypothetical protein